MRKKGDGIEEGLNKAVAVALKEGGEGVGVWGIKNLLIKITLSTKRLKVKIHNQIILYYKNEQ